ncbi:unnamed protein product [Cylindrotheca closterium]|uniref:Uncharacterized protein n=1 Tax=Cylindrotheca closterium TaxID=2856 RepID=A0AAD2G624_9STRA|nr:unnamed protein product [Cylindrotheca closterium]
MDSIPKAPDGWFQPCCLHYELEQFDPKDNRLGEGTTGRDSEDKEDRILMLRESHFLVPGIMAQIQRLMVGHETDLECNQLPSSYRDAKRPGEIVPPDVI